MAHPSTIMLIIFGGLILIGAIAAEDTGIWNDETVANTITQTNTNYSVCMGATCYAGWQVSISNNASIAGSAVCTPTNGLCNQTIAGLNISANVTGTGTANTIPLWIDADTIGDSRLNQSNDYLHSDLGLNFTASTIGHALGSGALASGLNTIALGINAKATASQAIAGGYDAQASNTRAIALGFQTRATGVDSIAIGYRPDATGTQSINIGRDGTCAGTNGVCIGYSATTTSGKQGGVSIGYLPTNGGTYSISMGFRTVISNGADNSFSLGSYTTAAHDNVTVIGTGIDNSNRLTSSLANTLTLGVLEEPLFTMTSTGISLGTLDTTPDATIDIETLTTTDIGLIVQGQASQSANLQNWQDDSGTVLLSVKNNGYLADASNNVYVGGGASDGFIFIEGNGRSSRSGVWYNSSNSVIGYTGVEGSAGQTFGNSSNTALILGSISGDTQYGAGGAIVLHADATQTISIGRIDVTPDAVVDIESNYPDKTVLLVQGETGQTSNLQEWQNESAATLSYVNANGTIYMDGNRVCTEGNGFCNSTTQVNGTYHGFINGSGNITAEEIDGNIQVIFTNSQAGGDLIVAFSEIYAEIPQCVIFEPAYDAILGREEEQSGDLIINTTHVWIDNDRETQYIINCYGE